MFELKESKKIELLDVNAQIYKHSKFNTQHIHLDADNDEKVFMVAFRTIPEDSTGVAHILEHTSLCGSKKYPVRDPFFMMIRRLRIRLLIVLSMVGLVFVSFLLL